MKNKKFILILLCLALCTTVFAGCKDKKPEVSPTPAPTVTQPQEDVEFSYLKSGDVYRLYHWWLTPGREDQEFTDDSLVSRNRLSVYKGIEEKYGVKYQFVPFQGSYWDNIRSSAFTGNPIADGMHAGQVSELVNHYYYNDIPASCIQAITDYDIDFSDEQYWAVEKMEKYATIDGKLWAFIFEDVGSKAIEQCEVLYFNYDNLRLGGYEPEQLYTWVKNKEWTWDKFYEVALACSKPDQSIYGLSRWGVSMNLVLSNNTDILKKVEIDGQLVDRFDGTNQKAMRAWDLYINMYKADILSPLNMGTSSAAALSDFQSGHVTFMFNAWYYTIPTREANPELQYGYLPPPMGPDATDYVCESGTGEIFCLLKGANNPNGTLKAMKELYKPIYGRDSQENKDLFDSQVADYVLDEGTMEMCYLIREKRKLYDANRYEWAKVDYQYMEPAAEDKILTGETTPQAYFESIADIINHNIDVILRRD